MDEVYVRTKLSNALKAYGYYPDTVIDGIKCHECHALVVPKIGKPDVMLRHPALRSAYVEVKVVRPEETSFPFKRITQEQYKYLSWWTGDCGGLGYLGLGIIRSSGKRDSLTSLYLVDWLDWVFIQNALAGQSRKSIPLKVSSRTQPVEVREHDMDITNLLQPWSLIKETRGWSLPKGHTAYQ